MIENITETAQIEVSGRIDVPQTLSLLSGAGAVYGPGPLQREDWLSGRHAPIERNRRMIAEFLDDYEEGMEERKR
jgi:hypothetical protein